MRARVISDKAIALAVERSILTPEQADGLRTIERELTPPVPEPDDDEKLRFITGFADIFVTLGVALFLGALYYIMESGAGSTPALAGLAAAAWVLAEFFTGKRRMALPSIVLLVVFVGAIFALAAQIAASLLPHTAPLSGTPISKGTLVPAAPNRPVPPLVAIPWYDWLPLCVGAVAAAGMAALHYMRFRVPITVAACVASLCMLAVTAVVGLFPALGETPLNIVFLVCGLAVFALAMRFDMSDPQRVSRRTDIAFWLHLLAAPLIVHPLVMGLLHGLDTKLTTGAAVGILWIFLALGVVAVIIDRRAILVSGLVYAGVAFGTVIKTLGFSNASLLVPTVLLALGGFILLLSAGWQPLRRAILRRLPQSLAVRLPHPLVISST